MSYELIGAALIVWGVLALMGCCFITGAHSAPHDWL
jgi:hypothetical protein